LLENYYTDNYSNFNQWYELLKKGESIYPSCMIPYDEWLDDYIQNIHNNTDSDVKELIRYMLFPFTRKLDLMHYDTMQAHIKGLDTENQRQEDRNLLNAFNGVEMYRRIENMQDTWEGLTWIVQLLPFSPYKAIKALKCYLEAEISMMPDERIKGIEQCIEIIEAKFIYTNKGLENYILDLKPREFEYLIEILYKEIGYKTVLTPATRDGGKDVIAEIDREDGKEKVYAECKLYRTTKLTKECVKAFGYTVIEDNINRGVMFCTGYVNDELKQLDSRIQIWSLEEIIILLNAHIGSNWSERLPNLLVKYINSR